jgi:predicted membrane GTPase involved in stress response
MNIRDLKAGVIIVKMTQSKDTINYKISSTLSNIDIDQKTPSFYVFNNRTPILFYVGLEGDFVFSSEYRNRLKKILKPFLIAYKEDANGKILSLAPNYNPVIWEIKMINQKIIYQKR